MLLVNRSGRVGRVPTRLASGKSGSITRSISVYSRLRGQVAEHCRMRGRLNRYSEARSISRAKASASFRYSITAAESLPILRSRRTVGRDPNP